MNETLNINNQYKQLSKEFIPYEQAMELKKLKYEVPCFAWYNKDKNLLGLVEIRHCDVVFYTQTDMKENECSAPMYDQVFKWFITEYGLFPRFDYQFKGLKLPLYYDYIISNMNKYSFRINNIHDLYYTLEDAQLDCLKDLIKIVKERFYENNEI